MKGLLSNLSKVRASHRILFVILSVALAVVMLAGVVFAATYVLNKTIPATVTVHTTPPTPPPDVPVDVYTDLMCTVPFTGTMDYGDLESGSATVTQVVYFKATEINPASVVIDGSSIDEAIATFLGVVGTPVSAFAWHPCPIALAVTPIADGTTNFNITITGSGSD